MIAKPSLYLILTLTFSVFPVTCALHKKEPSKRKRHIDVAAYPKRTDAVDVISADKTGTLVSADWMRRYKLLESKHSAIPEDEAIYMEGDKYRIPVKVADHFSRMVRESN
jgi:hypothetical protein